LKCSTSIIKRNSF